MRGSMRRIMGTYPMVIVLLYVSLVFCAVVSKSEEGEEIILASSEARMGVSLVI
jgi:hypothetical protein